MLALNNAHATELSWLDSDALVRLLREAFHARAVGTVDAFLLAFDETADYDSPNYRWFRARHDRFIYVDRVVVAPQVRGRGLARLLYHDLFETAARAGHARILCEVNVAPPNPASDAFHARLGFVEVGRGKIPDTAKTVRYLLKPLVPAGASM
jgi:predicted GNAT superfamily acetyltransferase